VTLVLAHRGANRDAPENTLDAFGRAVALGADGVELDVHRTADGRLVVRHDAATTGGLVLADLGLEEIRRALPEVPVLEEALDVCTGRLVNVEIKNSPREPDWDPDHTAAALLVELLARRDGRDRLLVSSFDLASVDRVRALAPHVPTALLTGRWTDPDEGLRVVAAHGHRALHPFVGTVAAERAVEIADRAHELGVEVNVWTVNDRTELARLAAAGVDALITDVPEVALAALGRRDGR
jgi:glycerophosphoryl diester phosphodiesterase